MHARAEISQDILCMYTCTFHEGWALSAFFFGYLLPQIPGGWLATRFGGKHVFGLGVGMSALLTLLTPVSADFSVWMLVVLRALEGLFQASFHMLDTWACIQAYYEYLPAPTTSSYLRP